MEQQPTITIRPVPHPNPQVQQVGFPLDHPYVEQCWAPIIGPSSVLLLRRVAMMCQDGRSVDLPLVDLARSLGLGKGSGRHGPMQHTLDRLERFGFLRQDGNGVLAVAVTVGPVSQRQLGRLTDWCRDRHHQLWGQHLDSITADAVAGNGLDRPTDRAGISDPPGVTSGAEPLPRGAEREPGGVKLGGGEAASGRNGTPEPHRDTPSDPTPTERPVPQRSAPALPGR